MAAFTFKVGTLDLTSYVDVTPGHGFDPTMGAKFREPYFTESPFTEMQPIVSLKFANREMTVPLRLKGANYTKDQVDALIQQIEQQLTLPGNTVFYQDAGATRGTTWDLVYGKFEPDFNYRAGEQGYSFGTLHLWCGAYGHTATQRSFGTYSGSGPALQVPFGPAYRAAVLVDSPVSYWRLGEASGTVAADQEGVNPGTYVGAQVPNLVFNPSLETNATYWVVSSGFTTNARQNTWAYSGTWSYRVTGTSTADSYIDIGALGGTSSIPVTAGQAYSVSVFANLLTNPAGGVRVRLVWFNAAGGVVLDESPGPIVTGTGVQQVTAANRVAPAGAAFLEPRIEVNNGNAGGAFDFYLDAAQVTATSTVQPYSDTQGITLRAAGALAGDPDKAVLLDGTSGYVSVPDSPGLRFTTALTLEAWVKPTGGTGTRSIIGKGTGPDYYWFIDGAGKPNFWINGGPAVTATTALTSGVYSYISVTWDGANVRFYLNGVLDATVALAGTITNSASPVTFGERGTPGSPLNWTGTLDEVAVYSTALSPAQILAHYNAGITASLMAAGASLGGDVPGLLEAFIVTGSYLADDGRLAGLAVLPNTAYTSLIPVGSFIGLSASAMVLGASGAYGSQFLAFDVGASPLHPGSPGLQSGGQFSAVLAPGSAYAGDNRVLGLARARYSPFGLAAFGPDGQRLGPTAIASAMDGWSVIDYGIVRVPTWMPTALIGVQAYPGPDYTASGMFAPRRAAPAQSGSQAWTMEHGPLIVLPERTTILDLDWNSPVIAADGFDGPASQSLYGQADLLGNVWANALPGQGSVFYNGTSGISVQSVTGALVAANPAIAAGNGAIDISAGLIVRLSLAASPANLQGVTKVQQAATYSGGAWLGWGMRADYYPTVTTLQVFGPAGALQVGSAPAVVSNMPYELRCVIRGATITGIFAGPSGIATVAAALPGTAPAASGPYYPGLYIEADASGVIMTAESFRARALASTGYKAADKIHLSAPANQNTRQNPSGVETVDLQARAKGRIPQLPVSPTVGGIVAISMPFDQGPANDVMQVEIRVRERVSMFL